MTKGKTTAHLTKNRARHRVALSVTYYTLELDTPIVLSVIFAYTRVAVHVLTSLYVLHYVLISIFTLLVQQMLALRLYYNKIIVIIILKKLSLILNQ
ncbi:hypothetical protein PPYR_15086 [Photinus pyralis]|uniref:Uncharacterized protein n=1 Tax=Photinus pyralis TaxID=7054 RepID=A0A5N3ZZM0_PHOPY|nr:hypothetical protein PPYR_15086 [Photinus pyralis]